jgi:IS30 family transposase
MIWFVRRRLCNSCDSYFSTQDLSIKNQIKRYIPKSCTIRIVKKSDVDWIENQLDSRPRKTLGYLSPIQFALKYKIALPI